MSSRTPRGNRFTRIHLENWRNFIGVEVALQERVFLVGPNASGKSNFLDALRFLHDLVAVGGGLQAAVEKRGGVSRIRALAARRYPDIVIRVQIAIDDVDWGYEIRFTQDNRQRAVVKSELVTRDGQIVESRETGDSDDPEQRTQTFIEQVSQNRDYRDVSDFFTGISYLHIVPQLVREPDRSVGRRNDPYGGDFLDQVAGTPEKTRIARLRRITEALKVAVPQLLELDLFRDIRGAPHLRGRYEHWRAQGAWQEESQFSDGTLRLMGLLWVLQDGAGPVLLEEPELSLHPEVVRYIPQMLWRVTRRSHRQVMLSTHSSEILLDESIGLNEVFLLLPEGEGTRVRPAGDLAEIRDLLEGGASLPEAIMPQTSPKNARQLALFDW